MVSDAVRASDSGQTVRVCLGPRSYEVRVVTNDPGGFGPFARASLDRTWSGRPCRRALLVTDEHVASLAQPYMWALERVGIAASLAVVMPGEASKSLEHASDLYDRLVAMRADRHTAMVALGGGVVGDLAGFVAATYARGLPLLMIPTSLLAQVDSSVGGKVGVNHPRAKNMIGAFHQPLGVWIDTATLSSLPPRELRAGSAEVIKYGMSLDAPLFHFLEFQVQAVLALEPDAVRHVVAKSCELKAAIVGGDEREETGLRSVLNFGHTVGHAIEAVAGYGGTYLHGEAVAIGMVAVCRLAERVGTLDRAATERLLCLVRRAGLPVACPGLDADALLDAMTRDKKNQAGRIRFVLPHGIGKVEMSDACSIEQIREVLAAITND
jgi:3-dehydroquinate synthase